MLYEVPELFVNCQLVIFALNTNQQSLNGCMPTKFVLCNNICTKSITYIHTYMQQKWSTYTRAYEYMCVMESCACGTEANMHDMPHYEALAEAAAPAATCHIACW